MLMIKSSLLSAATALSIEASFIDDILVGPWEVEPLIEWIPPCVDALIELDGLVEDIRGEDPQGDLDARYDDILSSLEILDEVPEDFLDFALNFRHDAGEMFITVHYEPTDEMAAEFEGPIESREQLERALGIVWRFRADNWLEAEVMADMYPFPDIDDCNE